jgi:Tfp pilus assembly protein PilN
MEQQISHSLFEYGLLGIAVFVLGYIVYSQWKKTNQRNDSLEIRLDAMGEQMRKYLDEEREQMLNVIRDNTTAFLDLKEILSQVVVKPATRKMKENKTSI